MHPAHPVGAADQEARSQVDDSQVLREVDVLLEENEWLVSQGSVLRVDSSDDVRHRRIEFGLLGGTGGHLDQDRLEFR